MVQPAFHIGNLPDGAAAGDSRLLVEISAQSLSYMVYKENPRELLLLKQYRLYTTSDRSSRDLIDEVIDSDTLITQHSGRSLVVYNFPEADIVPDEYYDDTLGRSVSRLTHGDSSSEFIFGEEIKGLGMHNVYRVPKDIHSLLKEKLAGSQYWHIYTLLLLSPDRPPADNVIRTVFYHDKFIAAFYASGQLQLIQTFQYQTPEDAAYYLLLICHQFQVAQSTVVISASGLIDSESALYSGLLKYFPEVAQEVVPAGITVNGLLEEFPAHYFSPMLRMSLCVL